MPRAKKGYAPKIQLLEMPLPYTGLDQSFPLALQRPGTTPTALNVRGFNAYSGRRSLSRRRGTVKGFINQIDGSHSIQELNSVIGTGYVNASGNYVPGSYWVTANVLVTGSTGGFTDGILANWVNGTVKWTLTLAGELILAAAADVTNRNLGSDGSAGGGYSDGVYIFSSVGIDNFVTKYAWSDGHVIWRTNVGQLPPVVPITNNIAMAVGGGKIYMSIVTGGLYRLNSSDGSAVDGSPVLSNPWVSDATINADHTQWQTDNTSYQMQSAYLDGYYTHPICRPATTGSGEFGCLLIKADGTKNYILHPSGIVGMSGTTFGGQSYAQDGTYFYFVGGYNLTANIEYVGIAKFTTAGTVVATFNGPIGDAILNPEITFDGASNALDITDIFGAAGTYRIPVGTLSSLTTVAAAGSVQPYIFSSNGGYGSRASFTANGTVGYFTNGQPAIWQNNDLTYTPQFLITSNPGGGSGVVDITSYNRNVTVIGVSNGTVAAGYNRAWSVVVDGVGALDPDVKVIRSDSNQGNLYFADGIHYVYYNPATNRMLSWQASVGELPVDGDGNTPRLICTWNGRTVLSGLPGDPQDWFMSAQGDPTDWAYNPSPSVETQAVAGENSPAGKVGDVITALIPYNDDVLIFGGDHTIFQMTGDPMAGGRIDRISDITGIAWGNAWTKTPSGGLYFFGGRGSVYFLNFSAVAAAEGNQLTRVSQAIDHALSKLNMADIVVRMAYDDRWQGVHVYISMLDGSASTHYYYDEQMQSWWSDQFDTNAHNPFSLLVFDGDDPADRCILLGDQDGWVRQYTDSALDDDGTIISSNVLIGPGSIKGGWEYLLNDLQCDLDQSGGSVDWSIKPGYSAQVAFGAAGLFSGTFSPSRNHSQAIRAAGIACYVDLSRAAKELPWAIESLRGKVMVYPHTRQRVF